MNGLLEDGVRVSALLVAAVLADILLRRKSAALRHWVLAMAVACAWATPVVSRVIPPWLAASFWRIPTDANVQPSPVSWKISRDSGEQDIAVLTEFSPAPKADDAGRSGQTARVLEAVWLLGIFIGAFTLLAGVLRLWWLASRTRDLDEGRWRTLAEQARHSYGLPCPVRLLQSEHPALLVTWGWRRARILLPASAREWSDDRIRVVLAHELAHIARGDWIVQLGADALRALYWFNPLVWIAARRLRAESECACDDEVLARGIDAPDYATHLVGIARSLHVHRQPWLPAPAMARTSSLEGRVRAMLNPTRNRRPVSWPARMATIGALVALTVPVAGLRAQVQFHSLTGAVLDPTNRVLPDTRLSLTNPASQAKYEVRADAAGRFEFVGLPTAEYVFEVRFPGFATLAEQVRIGGDTVRDVRLRVGSLEESITVTDRNAPVAPPDASTLQKREDARRRFAEIQQREAARCAEGGGATPIGGRILPPLKLLDARPAYPDRLRDEKVGGIVTMDAVIGIDGRVREVKNMKGPHPDLEAAAAEAVRQWQFSPTLLNCEPIDVDMSVTTRFAIQP